MCRSSFFALVQKLFNVIILENRVIFVTGRNSLHYTGGSKSASRYGPGVQIRCDTGLKLQSLRTIEYGTNTCKKYFCTFRMIQIALPYGERNKEWPNFSRMFSQNLPISAAFFAILKIKVPQYNAHRLRSDEGRTLETSASKLFTVANLRYQLI